ncbi:MAG: cupin domain-containing protein [Planctomycetota bacterium]
MLIADQIIELLSLEPLPGEGGWYRETYKSSTSIPGAALPTQGAERSCSTQIYYLLRSGAVSALHRVKSDEVFHHYMGDPVTQLRVDPEGRAEVVVIGQDITIGQRPQVVVPAGWWQGAIMTADLEGNADAFALMGCTVSPGFEWDDFELVQPDRIYPEFQHARSAFEWFDRLLA